MSKYKVSHLNGSNPIYMDRLGEELTESSHTEKDLGVLVREKLNMSKQIVLAAWKATSILGCFKREIAGRVRESSSILPSCSPIWSTVSRPGVPNT